MKKLLMFLASVMLVGTMAVATGCNDLFSEISSESVSSVEEVSSEEETSSEDEASSEEETSSEDEASSEEEDSSSEEESSSEDEPAAPITFVVGMPVLVDIPADGSVTIESAPNMLGFYLEGDYQVTWDETIENLQVYYGMQPVANGDVITAASPMMPTQLSVSTTDGAALTTRIMVAEYVAPPTVVELGDNSIDVQDPFKGKSISFTAETAGTYVFKAAADEENGQIGIVGEYGAEWFDFPYAVEMEEDETIVLTITTLDYTEDTVDFAIEELYPVMFMPGQPAYVEIYSGVSVTLEGYIRGDYVVSWDETIENLSVSFGGEVLENGDIITASNPRMPTQLVVSTTDNTYLATRILVAEYVEPATPIYMGANSVDVAVEDGWPEMVNVVFTAEADGVYALNVAEGETNADIYLITESMTEWIEVYPYAFELDAGESITFGVTSADWEADTIDFVISEAQEVSIIFLQYDPTNEDMPYDSAAEGVTIMKEDGTTIETTIDLGIVLFSDSSYVGLTYKFKFVGVENYTVLAQDFAVGTIFEITCDGEGWWTIKLPSLEISDEIPENWLAFSYQVTAE